MRLDHEGTVSFPNEKIECPTVSYQTSSRGSQGLTEVFGKLIDSDDSYDSDDSGNPENTDIPNTSSENHDHSSQDPRCYTILHFRNGGSQENDGIGTSFPIHQSHMTQILAIIELEPMTTTPPYEL